MPVNILLWGSAAGDMALYGFSFIIQTAFGGCWAVSPYPVDFSNFVGVDLYEDDNFYKDKNGNDFPFLIVNGAPISTLRKELTIESFMNDGEQFQAFEAEFGPPDKKGEPKKVFNRTAGVIDKQVVKEWMPYDMGLYVKNNWNRKGDAFVGKVHVYASANDNFFLNRAVEAFGEKAKSVNADVIAEIIPDANHFSIWSPAFTARVQHEIDELIR